MRSCLVICQRVQLYTVHTAVDENCAPQSLCANCDIRNFQKETVGSSTHVWFGKNKLIGTYTPVGNYVYF